MEGVETINHTNMQILQYFSTKAPVDKSKYKPFIFICYQRVNSLTLLLLPKLNCTLFYKNRDAHHLPAITYYLYMQANTVTFQKEYEM